MPFFFFFLELLMTDFVCYVHESYHVEADRDYLILHILNKMHIIPYFNFIHVKCTFIVRVYFMSSG